jgi:16S rRNA (cytidine1402-2'-O)-methyltransferase
MSDTGNLYVVSTPIGNMGDFSFRAVEVLRGVALILAEDTRHARTLLDHYEIRTPAAAYHEHNEAKATPGIVARLQSGDDIALISDAGTPLLSDPGARLVAAAVAADVPVIPIPGASALLAALTASALSAERFVFYGFLPRKGKERTAALDEIAASPYTSVIYEAANRLAASLQDLAARAGDRQAAVARELTKKFEEVKRGTVDSLSAYYNEEAVRGEVVLLVAGAPERSVDEGELRRAATELRDQGLSVRDVSVELTKRGAPRNLAYRIAREAKADMGHGK